MVVSRIYIWSAVCALSAAACAPTGPPARAAARHRPSMAYAARVLSAGCDRAFAMDEPEDHAVRRATSSLDPDMVKEVLDTMLSLADEGMAMICVTHEMGLARQIPDRAIFMDAGQIIEADEPASFFSKARHPRTQSFLAQVLL